MEGLQRVCPDCGSPAGDVPFCGQCGLNLGQLPRLPSREEWEASQAASGGDLTVRPLATEHRKAILEQVLAHEVKPQYRLLHRGEIEATYEIAPNHVLHGVLSLLTLGLWLIVWFFIAASKRHVGVRIDEYGRVQYMTGTLGWGPPRMPPAPVSLPPGVSIPPPPPSPPPRADVAALIKKRRAEEKEAKRAKRVAKQ